MQLTAHACRMTHGAQNVLHRIPEQKRGSSAPLWQDKHCPCDRDLGKDCKCTNLKHLRCAAGLYCRAPALSRGWFRQFMNLEIGCRGPFHPLATPLVLSYLDPHLSSPSSAIQQELWALTPPQITPLPAPLPGFPSSGDVLRHLYSHLAQSSPL